MWDEGSRQSKWSFISSPSIAITTAQWTEKAFFLTSDIRRDWKIQFCYKKNVHLPFLNFGKSLQECCHFLLCWIAKRIRVSRVNNLLPPLLCSVKDALFYKCFNPEDKKKYTPLSSKLNRFNFLHNASSFTPLFFYSQRTCVFLCWF